MSQGATPNGVPIVLPQHKSWLNSSDFLNFPTGLGLSNTSNSFTNETLDIILAAACEWVEEYCKCYFVQQTITEQYPDATVRPNMSIRVPLENGPATDISQVAIQNYIYFVFLDLRYMTLFQNESNYTITPIFIGSYGDSFIPEKVYELGAGTIWTTYTFGYPIGSIPGPVYQASIMVATRMIAQQENPTGATESKMGQKMLAWKLMGDSKDPMVRQIEDLLRPYVKQYIGAV